MPEVTVYSSTADGFVSCWDALWADVRSGVGGSKYAGSTNNASASATRAEVYGSSSPYKAYITRSFFYFDLSGLPGSAEVQSVELQLYKSTLGDSSVCAQQGTQADALSVDDYNAFAGSEYGHISWTGSEEYKSISFNTEGKNYIAGRMGIGAVKICCREYDHDYLDVAPGQGQNFRNGCYYADNSGTDKDPKLVITYSIATVVLDKQTINVIQHGFPQNVSVDKQTIGIAQVTLPTCKLQIIETKQCQLPTIIGLDKQAIETDQKPLATDIFPGSQKIGALQLPVPTFQPRVIGMVLRPLATDIDLDKQVTGVLQKPLATDIDVLNQIIALVQASPEISSIDIWIEHSKRFVSRPIVICEISFDDGIRRFAVEDTELDGKLYEGRVLQFGTVHRAISDTDGYFEISDITTRLANTDGFFSNLDNKKFLNREVRYRTGFPGTDLSAFVTVFTGVLANFKFPGTVFELTVKSIAYSWFEKDYGHTIDETDWPFAASGIAETKMPILYGDLTGTI